MEVGEEEKGVEVGEKEDGGGGELEVEGGGSEEERGRVDKEGGGVGGGRR